MSDVEYDPVAPLRMAWIETNIDKLATQAEEIEGRLYGKLPVVDKEQRVYLKEKLDSIYRAMGMVLECATGNPPKPLKP